MELEDVGKIKFPVDFPDQSTADGRVPWLGRRQLFDDLSVRVDQNGRCFANGAQSIAQQVNAQTPEFVVRFPFWNNFQFPRELITGRERRRLDEVVVTEKTQVIDLPLVTNRLDVSSCVTNSFGSLGHFTSCRTSLQLDLTLRSAFS